MSCTTGTDASRPPGLRPELLGRASMQTTGGIYAGWDGDQLAATVAEVLDGDQPTTRPLRNLPVELQEIPANEGLIPPTGFEPVLPP
jgi:hypothetical protein